MSEFTNFDPKTTLIKNAYASEMLGQEHWVVTKGFEFYIGKKEDNCYVYIPQGYLTDGATVPEHLKRLVPTWGVYGAATIVHDYLCEYLSFINGDTVEPITRARSDFIFLQAMSILGVPWYRRIPMYLAVRGYSMLVAKDKPTPWRAKQAIEKVLEQHFNKHGNYDF